MPEVDYSSFVRLKEKVEILTGERGGAGKPGAAVLVAQLARMNLGGGGQVDNSAVLRKLAEIQEAMLGKTEQAADSAKLATKLPSEIRRMPYCVTSGTSSAVKLAPVGFPVGELFAGDMFRFRAKSANGSGGTTVAIGDLAAMPVLTVTGAEPPAGYFRTDADTTLTYDKEKGSFIAGRQDERGAASGGEYIRYACGRVEISLQVTTEDYAPDEKRAYRWALPTSAKSIHPTATVLMTDTSEPVTILGAGLDQPGRIYIYLQNGAEAQQVRLSLQASGLWY